MQPHIDTLQDLAEEAVVYAYPLYEMCRMRAATSPQRTDAAGEAPRPQRWCNVFTHARQRRAQARAASSRRTTTRSTPTPGSTWATARS